MGFLAPAQAVVAQAIAQAIAPPPPPDITRWCEENIVFDARSPMPGPFDILRFAFLREIHEVLSPEHPSREVTLRGSAQWGKTVSVIQPTIDGQTATITYTVSDGTDEDTGTVAVGVKAPVVIGPAPTTTTSTVTMTSWGDDFGETSPLGTAKPVGVLADGSPFIVSGGSSVEILGFSTPSGAVARTFVEGASGPMLGSSSGSYVAHGAMLNPGQAASQGSLGAMQSDNAGYSSYEGGSQGWDEVILKSNYANYSASKNIDPGITGEPITLTEGTVVKAISRLTPAGGVGSPVIDAFLPVTVLTETPPEGAFRPGFANPDKTVKWTVADLRMDRLPSRSAAGIDVPVSSELIKALSLVLTHHHTFNVNSGNITPTNGRSHPGLSSYYGEIAELMFDAMLGLTLDAWTADEKLAITIRLVQQGIDIAARVQQGGVFYPNGGHSHGRLGCLSFAAEMLDSDELRQVCRTQIEYGGYKSVNEGASVFGERNMFVLVDQGMIDVSKGMTISGRSVEFFDDMIDWPEWVGELGNYTPRNLLGNTTDQKKGYLHICMQALTSQILVARQIPGMTLLQGDPALLDFADRYAQWKAGDDAMLRLTDTMVNVGTTGNHPKPWVIDTWVAYRGTDHLWTRDTAGDLRVVANEVDPVTGAAHVLFNRDVLDPSLPNVTAQGNMLIVTTEFTIAAGAIRDGFGNTNQEPILVTLSPPSGGGGTVTPPPVTTGRIGFGIWSQSQTAYMLDLSGKTAIPPPTLVNDVTMTVYGDEHGTGGTQGNPEIRVDDVTQANLDSDRLNPAMGAMGEFFAFRHPGRHIDIVDFATPGTGFQNQMDDAVTDILWSDKQAMLDRVRADGRDVHDNIFNWMGDDAAAAKSYYETMFPLFTGQRFNGEIVNIGDVNPDSYLGRSVDHIMYDLSGAGRGVFDNDVPISFLGWPTFNDRETSDAEDINFTTKADGSYAGRDVQLDRPARDQHYRLLNDPSWEPIRGWHGPSCHIANMGYGTHPVTDDPDGQILYMWPWAITIGRRLGDTKCRNMVINEAIRDADGTSIRLRVTDSEGNALDPLDDTLTTLRIQRGLPAPAPLPPHWQEAMGVEIVRSSGSRRPVYRLDATGYPDEFKGTVTIEGDETVVVPLIPFADDEYCEYLRGDASTMLKEPRDIDAKVYQDVPLVHVASLYQDDATYPCPGIPVEPQPPVEVLDGTRTGGGKMTYPIPGPGTGGGTGGGGTPAPAGSASWSISGNDDGTFTVDSVGDLLTSPIVTGNDDGTFTYEE